MCVCACACMLHTLRCKGTHVCVLVYVCYTRSGCVGQWVFWCGSAVRHEVDAEGIIGHAAGRVGGQGVCPSASWCLRRLSRSTVVGAGGRLLRGAVHQSHLHLRPPTTHEPLGQMVGVAQVLCWGALLACFVKVIC